MSYCTTLTYRSSLVTYADVLKGKKPLETRDPLAFLEFRRIHAQLNWRFCNSGHPYSIPNNYSALVVIFIYE